MLLSTQDEIMGDAMISEADDMSCLKVSSTGDVITLGRVSGEVSVLSSSEYLCSRPTKG